MKPEMLSQHLDYEQKLVQSEINVGREVQEKKVNLGVEPSAEKFEQRGSSSAQVNDVSITTLLPSPVINNQDVDLMTTIVSAPLVANDDDLIEKEWVDRAKKIITDTRDNPHQREKAVSELQVTYLKKRYGKELGVNE